MDWRDMNRGSAGTTDWLMAGNAVLVCWQGWQLQTFGGANGSRLGKGGATENADFLSLSFSNSGTLASRDFFPMRESTLNEEEFCIVDFLYYHWGDVALSTNSGEVLAYGKKTRFIRKWISKGAFIVTMG